MHLAIFAAIPMALLATSTAAASIQKRQINTGPNISNIGEIEAHKGFRCLKGYAAMDADISPATIRRTLQQVWAAKEADNGGSQAPKLPPFAFDTRRELSSNFPTMSESFSLGFWPPQGSTGTPCLSNPRTWLYYPIQDDSGANFDAQTFDLHRLVIERNEEAGQVSYKVCGIISKYGKEQTPDGMAWTSGTMGAPPWQKCAKIV